MILPEGYIRSVKLSQIVSVSIPSAGISAIEGKVQAIEPSADGASRSFTVQVSIPFHQAIHAGMFSRVTIGMGNKGRLMIPTSALIHQGQLTGIFLVDSDQVARFRVLRIGQTFGAMVEVLSGFKAGDRYVAIPPPNLVDGHRVEALS
jgi:multidrug efflux pump subunit AcrA (membrane-fusion protein)